MFGYARTNSIKQMKFDPVLISSLNRWRCPPTVAWLIAFRIINSIYCHSFRLFSHISKKILKTLPLFADSYSNVTAVFSMLVLAWAIASGHHTLPRPIGKADVIFMAVPVFYRSVDYSLNGEASTGVTVSGTQVVIQDNQTIAAPTGTNARFSTLTAGIKNDRAVGNYDQPCKFSTGRNRIASEHSVGYFNIVFSGGRSARTGARCETLHSLGSYG